MPVAVTRARSVGLALVAMVAVLSTTLAGSALAEEEEPYSVSIISPQWDEVTDAVTIEAATAGGPAVGEATWYRIDSGPWQWLGANGDYVAEHDVSDLAAGPHLVEVAATDFSVAAYAESLFGVASRLSLEITNPPYPLGVVGSNDVLVEAAISHTVLDGSALSAWARINDGPWVAMTVDAGTMSASLPLPEPVAAARIQVAATDYRGSVEYDHVMVASLNPHLDEPLQGIVVSHLPGEEHDWDSYLVVAWAHLAALSGDMAILGEPLSEDVAVSGWIRWSSLDPGDDRSSDWVMLEPAAPGPGLLAGSLARPEGPLPETFEVEVALTDYASATYYAPPIMFRTFDGLPSTG